MKPTSVDFRLRYLSLSFTPKPVVNALSNLADIEKVGEAIKERRSENISQAEIREMLSSPERGARRAKQRTDKVTDWNSAFDDIPGPEKTQGGDIHESKKTDRSIKSADGFSPIVNTLSPSSRPMVRFCIFIFPVRKAFNQPS